MSRSSRLPALLLAFVLSWMALPFAFAAERQMVSSAAKTLNMRTGPGQRYEAHWTVGKGYPFRVIGRKGDWLRVSDFENDKAWVYRPMTSRTPHHVVKAKVAVLRTLERRGDWVKVRHEGGGTGWVARRLVWGW